MGKEDAPDNNMSDWFAGIPMRHIPEWHHHDPDRDGAARLLAEEFAFSNPNHDLRLDKLLFKLLANERFISPHLITYALTSLAGSLEHQILLPTVENPRDPAAGSTPDQAA